MSAGALVQGVAWLTELRTPCARIGVERVAVLVAVGHGRRTALAALARCRAPSLNRSSSAPKSLCAARRRHMTPRRVLVVQSRGPLRVAMEHTSGALRSRNSASLAPEHVGAERLDGGQRGCVTRVVLGKNNRTSQARLSWVVTVFLSPPLWATPLFLLCSTAQSGRRQARLAKLSRCVGVH